MLTTKKARLAEAEAALHDLLLGKAVVECRDSTGESVRFTAANASRLRVYIAQLKAEIAGTTSRAPLRPILGNRW